MRAAAAARARSRCQHRHRPTTRQRNDVAAIRGSANAPDCSTPIWHGSDTPERSNKWFLARHAAKERTNDYGEGAKLDDHRCHADRVRERTSRSICRGAPQIHCASVKPHFVSREEDQCAERFDVEIPTSLGPNAGADTAKSNGTERREHNCCEAREDERRTYKRPTSVSSCDAHRHHRNKQQWKKLATNAVARVVADHPTRSRRSSAIVVVSSNARSRS